MAGAEKGGREFTGKRCWDPAKPEILPPLPWSLSSLASRDLPPWSSACSARQRPGALPCRCQTRALRTPSSQSTAARARSTAVSAPPSGSAGDNSFIPSAGGTPAAQLRWEPAGGLGGPGARESAQAWAPCDLPPPWPPRLREGLGFAARRLPRGRLAEEEAAAAAHAFHQPAAAGAGGDLPEEPLPRHEHARGDRRVDQPHRGPRAGMLSRPATRTHAGPPHSACDPAASGSTPPSPPPDPGSRLQPHAASCLPTSSLCSHCSLIPGPRASSALTPSLFPLSTPTRPHPTVPPDPGADDSVLPPAPSVLRPRTPCTASLPPGLQPPHLVY